MNMNDLHFLLLTKTIWFQPLHLL